MLSTLAKLTALYYDLLELHTEGKAWSIRTNKLLKKKIKKQQNKANRGRKRKQDQHNEEDNDIIEKVPDEENASEKRKKMMRKMKKKQMMKMKLKMINLFIKKKRCNFVSEFAIIVDYKVLEKYFFLIKEDKLLNNSSELNIAIYKYFQRILDTLKADWIFFQLDFLYIINSIIQNKQLTKKRNQLFQLFKINRLMSVEFFSDFLMLQLKILFQKITKIKQQKETLIKININMKDLKRKGQDLIENYEKYQDCEKLPEEQLSLLLSQNSFIIKSPVEIRKRIRKFRLEEGNDRAIALYQQQYEMISMKNVEIMVKSVRSLIDQSSLQKQIKSKIVYIGVQLLLIIQKLDQRRQFERVEEKNQIALKYYMCQDCLCINKFQIIYTKDK
ncbi:unnamed protein product [Paramecium primaurelia]|uniref:Uncharacterized protein n=1 Tax=Paramecium primaurelia TaxID=5886 RepID=A0A8S1QR50_PARPR|nr:unnamed protein product [Paramecium primaurelia]